MTLPYEVQALFHYIFVQFKQILPFWLSGLAVGSIIVTFGREVVTRFAVKLPGRRNAIIASFMAAALGAVSPVTLHGAIPVLAALMQLNVGQHIIAAFLVSTVLINPNLVIYSLALGSEIALLRLILCVLAGVVAGLLTTIFGQGRDFFNSHGFEAERDRTAKAGWKAAGSSFLRGFKKTAPYLGLGILLAALFQVYFPSELFYVLFRSNRGLSVLYSASLGVPTYYCGGGTIPLMRAWMNEGMSTGSVIAYMLTGPATKFTNLTAVKILMPGRKFWLYVVFSICFGIAAGIIIDLCFAIL